jgi:hypothetical protein
MCFIVNQAKMKSFRREPVWKFGILVARTHLQALELDESNDGGRIRNETTVIVQYVCDQGKGGNAPDGYKKTRCQTTQKNRIGFSVIENCIEVNVWKAHVSIPVMLV